MKKNQNWKTRFYIAFSSLIVVSIVLVATYSGSSKKDRKCDPYIVQKWERPFGAIREWKMLRENFPNANLADLSQIFYIHHHMADIQGKDSSVWTDYEERAYSEARRMDEEYKMYKECSSE